MTENRYVRRAIIGATAALLLAAGVEPVGAQECLSHVSGSPIFDSSNNCTAAPDYPRMFGIATQYWNGNQYLFADNGNNLMLWRINTPRSPRAIAESYFSVANVGDSDYDLVNFSICDDCRYGVANFKGKTVLFDLGGGTDPKFAAKGSLPEPRYGGGATFKHGGTQYLVLNGASATCGSFPEVFVFGGVNADDLTHVDCLTGPGFDRMEVGNGIYYSFRPVGGDVTKVFYMQDKIGAGVRAFKVEGTGSNATFTYMGSPFSNVTFGRTRGFSIDAGEKLALTVYDGTATIWDLTDGFSPAILARITDALSYPVNVGTIQYPFLWLAVPGINGPATYDVSVPTSPVRIDPGFWSRTNPWNSYDCLTEQGARFSADGSTLYVTRYSTLQLFDFRECGSIEPRAAVGVSPQDAFPGDVVTVSDTSTGPIESEFAFWVTEGPSPDDPVAVACGPGGDQSCGQKLWVATRPAALELTVPPEILADVEYHAHSAIRATNYPCDLGNVLSCGERYTSEEVVLDRTPEASISVTPVTSITGDTVTLTATAEGTPGAPAASPFEWTISSPTGAHDDTATGSSTQVTLAESGMWTFDLDVRYQHEDEVVPGQLYTAHAPPATRTVSSLAADFSVNPTNPCHDDAVTLTSTSKAQTGLTLHYDWSVQGPDTLTCGDAASCTDPDGLAPGTYTATLTLTADQNEDVSTKTRTFTVKDCSVQLDFHWSPSSPEIGQAITFSVDGVVAELESATWSFGGAGCTDYSTPATCTPGLFTDCMDQGYKYASGGTKSVSLSIIVDGQSYGPVSKQITVASTGSCSGTTTCTYAASTSSASLPAAGGSGTFKVNQTGDTACTWSASSSASWLSVSPTSSSGTRTVTYSAGANGGATRSANITISYGTASFVVRVTQSAAGGGLSFAISDTSPDIGQKVTFTADSSTTPVSWSFGEANCAGDSPTVECGFLGDLCRTMEWTFPSSGTKSVTYTAQEGTVTKTLTVASSGECEGTVCEADAAPTAAFTISASPALVGEQVVFTDQSTKGAKVAALGFSVSPSEPEIGQLATFTISGYQDIDKAIWDFGDTPCGDFTQHDECSPFGAFDCLQAGYKYATAGTKTVSLSVVVGDQTIGPVTRQVTVANAGECTTQTPQCTYTLSPSSADFTAAGGSGSFQVKTQSGCDWTASSSRSWASITGGASGIGSGTVSYTVAANSGGTRTASISAGNRQYTIRQEGQSGGGGSLPTSWRWTVRRGATTIASSTNQTFAYTFIETGTYTVTLTASNCKGSSSSSQTLEVVESLQAEDQIIPAAAHTSGLQNSSWKTNLRVFHPGDEPITVNIDFLKEATNNSGIIPGVTFMLEPMGTMVIDDIIDVIPGIVGDHNQGSLRFTFEGGGGTPPVIMSRTYTGVAGEGSFGQFVPAVPVGTEVNGDHTLPGLVQNQTYRTNIGLANLSPEGALGVVVKLFDESGAFLGSRTQNVPPLSSVLLVEASKWVGLAQDIDLYTARIDPNGNDITVYASLTDQRTNDPTLYIRGEEGSGTMYVLGLAHLGGALGSVWRSDVNFYNPHDESISFKVDYVPEVATPLQPHLQMTLDPGQEIHVEDALGYLLGDDASSKGYLKITASTGSRTPQVTARTYNLADDGTYGQNLPTFTDRYFLHSGERGFLAGVENSSTKSSGFRTNVALLNLDDDAAAKVRITVYDELGEILADVPSYTLPPGQFIQDNLFYALGLDSMTVDASVVVEVLSGGPVVGYASIVDNVSQDPSLVPMMKLTQGQ